MNIIAKVLSVLTVVVALSACGDDTQYKVLAEVKNTQGERIQFVCETPKEGTSKLTWRLLNTSNVNFNIVPPEGTVDEPWESATASDRDFMMIYSGFISSRINRAPPTIGFQFVNKAGAPQKDIAWVSPRELADQMISINKSDCVIPSRYLF